MSKTQRWEWAVGLKLEEIDEHHLQSAYKLNWDNLCKFDSCRKNCKRILCLACFDKSWIDNDSANTSNSDSLDAPSCEQKRSDLKSFVGLKNLGATCYVNCLLQLWFHNPALRKAIYEWRSSKNTDNPQNIVNNSCAMYMIGPEQNGDRESTPNQSTKRVIEEDRFTLTPSKRSNKPIGDDQTSSQETNKLTPSRSSPRIISPSKQLSRELAQNNPIEQLQLIFARLQFTNKKSIDPFSFIDSLALNAAEQQDAQEFGNLFMEFLEKSFANQSNTFVSKVIQNQFCGRYSYATICDNCKHSSLSDSKFYELDLSIQNLETLHDCLNEFFRPVPLDGKYNCSRCQRAQSAHRKIILKSLPPTLNLQLLRFVYDVQRNVRQKLNSYIIFPEVLDMNPYLSSASRSRMTLSEFTTRGYMLPNCNHNLKSSYNKSNIYLLSAVLIHRGSSPHSGHYIAHIKDRITKDWYKFNDDSVERIGPQLHVSTDGESISILEDKTETIKVSDVTSGKVSRLESKSLKSKTAYMLVYQAQDNEALSYPSDHSEKWHLPDHLQTAVAEENSRSDEIFESLQIAREVDLQIMDARKNQIKSIYGKLVCRDPTEKFEFISKQWLQDWLTNSSTSAKFAPIDNSRFLCIHDKLDFRKIDQVKCVRSEGADLLYKEFGGGIRLTDAMCRKCVELEVKLIQLKERMKEDQKYITSQAKFKLDASYDFADAYIVGKNSYRDWQALVMMQFKKSYPELLQLENDNNTASGNQNDSDEDDQKMESKNSRDHEVSRNNGNNDDNSDSESNDEAVEKFVFNSDILCEHDQLINDTSAWRIVPKEVWFIFKHYFGNDPTRPLIEYNANTIMCPECKKQEVEQQEIGDILKQKASEQKSKLPDLFHNRKRASWCSMLPHDIYYALDRHFLSKWQKFIRNPCNQEQPSAIVHKNKLVCEHEKSLYNCGNSNPISPECSFVLVTQDELAILTQYYPIDHTVRFTADPNLVEEKVKVYLASLKISPAKRVTSSLLDGSNSAKPLENSGDFNHDVPCDTSQFDSRVASKTKTPMDGQEPGTLLTNEDIDLTEIDWSDCIVSDPKYCSDCHEIMKQGELEKLLNYESATIYVTKVENVGPNSGHIISGIGNADCDNDTHTDNINNQNLAHKNEPDSSSSALVNDTVDPIDEHALKRRKKIYVEDEANDFVPPGVARQPTPSNSSSNSILRRTTRRNRNRQQAYTIKPYQTLLELKKEIFSRSQVLPVDQRLFLNDVLLDDNNKTMTQLRIVPNSSLRLEVSLFAHKIYVGEESICRNTNTSLTMIAGR